MCHSAGKFMTSVFLDAEDGIHVAVIPRDTRHSVNCCTQ